MKKRLCSVKRETKETNIYLKLNIDGRGRAKISTGIEILNHLLELFCFHGFFDLELLAKGKDLHHLNEDIGIVIGEAFKKALADKKGIRRFGFFSVPMDENVSEVIVDIGGRSYFKLVYENKDLLSIKNKSGYSFKEIEHLLDSFCRHLGANLYIKIAGSLKSDFHSLVEPIFKALGIALDQATQIDKRRASNIPSSKGVID
ncbi:MAG: imidazoleglycerol-phosphate dehydratase [Candidatus Omnitrophica bacterium]|nr:imidazoleglycerol-phosphate dehydratase [Candidatus Omnitrophota bacterium]MCM8800073.1 imidazoleglycerol-phosphate dehydratase [Candidatus Omnitrophota bacterium]